MPDDGKTIQLQCSNCNGMMEISADAKEVTCPYCGAKEKILDSDAVAVERIKSDTYKELEYAKMANEREKQSIQEKKAEQNEYRKSKFSKVTIVAAFCCCLAMFTAFAAGHILAGLIALIQISLFGTSWLMGMQIIKEKKKFVYVALAVLGFLLIVPFAMSNNVEKLDKLDWPDSALAKMLPQPESSVGKIEHEAADSLTVYVGNTSQEDFAAYIGKVSEAGFTVDYQKGEDYYSGDHADGFHVNVTYEGNQTMCIRMEKKAADTPAEEPKQDNADAESAANPENANKQEEVKPSDSGNLVDGMRPEFKEAMDSYEQFYDEYIEFVRRYSENATDIEPLAQYGKMTAKALEMDQKFAKWGEGDLNDAELAYYAEVTTRIAEKSLEIANMGL